MRFSACLTISQTLVLTIAAATPSWGIDAQDTLLLTDPAIGPAQIAFTYDRDLWTANIDGDAPRRITSHTGSESHPVFSPDGKLIAYSAQYDGNTDVFVVSSAGGVPRRLTWHPGPDEVLGFSPDGKSVLFRSRRSVFTNRYTRLYTVPTTGGFPSELKIPNAHKASFSPDGTRLAYTPIAERMTQWKNYRGGTVSRIWLYQFDNHHVVEIPQPPGRSNDTDPMWIGEQVFFRSDRNGEFNLFAYDVGSGDINQLTHFDDFPILMASKGGGKIIFEQAGRLHTFDPEAKKVSTLKIGVAAELLESRARYVEGSEYVRQSDISPSGKRAVFETRGEIVTVPAEKGDPRNLSQTTGIHERSPAWSPDGKSIAYFSDADGEYALHIRSTDRATAVRTIKLEPGFYFLPLWSPNNEKIVFGDHAYNYYLFDVETGSITQFGVDNQYGPAEDDAEYDWSPDSRWIVYTNNSATYYRTIYVYSLAEQKSYAITDGLSDASSPEFGVDGQYLYFFASTDAGPVRLGFELSSNDMDSTRSLYVAVLRNDLLSPLAKESDEEEASQEEKTKKDKPEKSDPDEKENRVEGSNENSEAKGAESDPSNVADATDKDQENQNEEEAASSDDEKRVRIDFEGLDQRILDLPLPAAKYRNLQAGGPGEIYFVDENDLKRFTFKKREAETVFSDVKTYKITPDKKKLLYLTDDGWTIKSFKDSEDSSKTLDLDAISLRIDPRSEWNQIFEEAWRINRDYFYASNYHGADWPAMRKKYSIFLPHLATRGDLNRVIRWMCSELSVGHHRVGGGDRLHQSENVPVGLLGADYEIAENRYRFKKVYGGLNWNPTLRSPLTGPGVDVKEGEFLLAVEGREVRPPTNLYSYFENSVGKITRIKVGLTPDGIGSRTVDVVPVANESALRNRYWVEGNLRKVHEATDGRVAYVYVPNTSTSGHAYFKRYFYPQADKNAIIVDERFNSGGKIADYYIDHLRKEWLSNWSIGVDRDFQIPNALIEGPKVMIIDETAGSGGDMLPWMFRKFKLGTLVGKRTWGGLVGTQGFPVLMDGGRVTAPNLAIWTDEGWIVENVGVPPDVEVEQWPADVIAGRDPQLEKAIEIVLEELKKNPPKERKRPPFPVRVRQ